MDTTALQLAPLPASQRLGSVVGGALGVHVGRPVAGMQAMP